jgi:hypothetical protein
MVILLVVLEEQLTHPKTGINTKFAGVRLVHLPEGQS